MIRPDPSTLTPEALTYIEVLESNLRTVQDVLGNLPPCSSWSDEYTCSNYGTVRDPWARWVCDECAPKIPGGPCSEDGPQATTARVWEVQQWDSYGIVLPNYGTTNGSISTVLIMLPFWTRQGLSPEYTWESLHPMVPSDITDPMALFDGLYAAYMEGFVENYEGARASRDKTFAQVRENPQSHFRTTRGT